MGGGTLMTQYWGGGAQDTFSYQLFKVLKKLGGRGMCPPLPSGSMVPDRDRRATLGFGGGGEGTLVPQY